MNADEAQALATCVSAAISGLGFALAYLYMRLGRRLAYCTRSLLFFCFLVLNAAGAVVALLMFGTFNPPDGASVQDVAKHYVKAAGFGLLAVSAGLVGVPKNPAKTDKFVSVFGALLRPIEDLLRNEVEGHELILDRLAATKGVTTEQLARGVSTTVRRHVKDDEERLKSLGDKIEAARSKEDRLILFDIALEFHSPRYMEREFLDFCLRQKI